MTLGEKITRLRKERGLSQEELSSVLNVSRQAVSKWETGDATPDVERVVALAEYFGVTTDWLLRDIDAPQKSVAPHTSVEKKPNIGQYSPAVMCVFWCISAIGLAMLFHGNFALSYGWTPVVGLMLQITAVILPVGYAKLAEPQNPFDFLKRFWQINIWFTAVFPARLAADTFIQFTISHIPENILYWLYSALPYTMWSVGRWLLFASLPILYIAFCLFVSLRVCQRKNKPLPSLAQ